MKRKNTVVFLFIGMFLFVLSCRNQKPETSDNILNSSLFTYQDIEPRWSSFENPTSGKGMGGSENKGAKGHPYDLIKAGEAKTLMDISGSGIITRMWITIQDRSPQMLRSLIFEIFWDGSEKPAVSAPFGDFFGNGLGRLVPMQNELFANPEGRSFNCFIPMPFKTGAKVVITNEGNNDLDMIFYDIDFVKTTGWNENNLYFHCYWNRDTATTPGVDYTILPEIHGKGRFLGVNFGVIANPQYRGSWWGEGEVKMYIDGDNNLPTLVGTGTEDYIGTAWGQGQYINRFTGCPVADTQNDRWTFYRYHIPDPIFFKTDIKVNIQAMGGNQKEVVIDMLEKGIPLIPVSVQGGQTFIGLMDSVPPVNLKTAELISGWTNFYRTDDWSSTAYFYLDKPTNNLPDLPGTELRGYKL
ncbi:MAG: DUF2961 domain-containing protein [Prolixibacteraceae bacterium]|nr:DUF2961 domain-containing protein [Prolixibacteraceae bacterium]MBN2774414.1 DUF2961 domain-containing protein [Prolixibacteraceae bacterium]